MRLNYPSDVVDPKRITEFAHLLADERVCLWTWKRMVEKTKVVWEIDR